jgi:hypothetical protein
MGIELASAGAGTERREQTNPPAPSSCMKSESWPQHLTESTQFAHISSHGGGDLMEDGSAVAAPKI